MASKPTKVPRWAATAPSTITGTIAEPSEDKKTVGFVTREKPPSQFLDWLFYIIYTWLQYLSDGAFVGNHSIAGSLTVGGEALTFTDFTFTVDTTTDQLQHTAHGLSTGDGPVRVSSTGTLPGGLTAGTDYWVINDFGDSLRLTTSRINALTNAGQIDITSTGSGTHTLLHQAGTTRVEDASVTRDLTVGGNLTVSGKTTLNGRLTVNGTIDSGTVTVPQSVGGPGATGVVDVAIGTDWSNDVVGVPVGRQISAVRVWIRDNVTGPTKLRATLLTATPNGTFSSVAFGAASAGTGALQQITLTLVSPLTVASGTMYRAGVHYDTGSAGCHVHHMEVDHQPQP